MKKKNIKASFFDKFFETREVFWIIFENQEEKTVTSIINPEVIVEGSVVNMIPPQENVVMIISRLYFSARFSKIIYVTILLLQKNIALLYIFLFVYFQIHNKMWGLIFMWFSSLSWISCRHSRFPQQIKFLKTAKYKLWFAP